MASKLDRRYHYLLINIEIDAGPDLPVHIKYDSLSTLMDIMNFSRDGSFTMMLLGEASRKNVGPPLQPMQQKIKTSHILKQANEVYFVK